MTDDLEQQLIALGQAETPTATEADLDAIERRVMTAVTMGAGPAGKRRWSAVLLVASALLLVVGGLAVLRGGGSDRELRLADANLVTLEAPGEAPRPAQPGDVLADGTVIEVAPGGSADFDGGILGPGRYRVVDGLPRRIAVDQATTTTLISQTTTPVTDSTSSSLVGAPPSSDGRNLTTVPSPPTVTDSTRRSPTVPTTDLRPTRSTTSTQATRPPTTVIDRPTSTAGPTTTRPADRPTTVAATVPQTRPPRTDAPASTTTTTTTAASDRERGDDRRP